MTSCGATGSASRFLQLAPSIRCVPVLRRGMNFCCVKMISHGMQLAGHDFPPQTAQGCRPTVAITSPQTCLVDCLTLSAPATRCTSQHVAAPPSPFRMDVE